MSGDDAEIDRLCSEGKLGEAARLRAEAGRHDLASQLYEQACAFAAAAEQSSLAGDLGRAMRLAVLSGDAVLHERIQRQLMQQADPQQVRQIAADLGGRGYHRHGGFLFRAIGDHLLAAEALERAGDAWAAAACFDLAAKPAAAARLLEAALRGDAHEAPGRLRVALGQLYARHGKHEAAVRVLQQLDVDDKWRRDGLLTLRSSMEQLGLHHAVRDLAAELRRHDIDPDELPRDVAALPDELGQQADTRLYGRYRVLREIAVTPHARLLEAIDTINEERVAVKILSAKMRGTGRDALQRFVREARALTQLRHPNVVALRAFIAEGPAMVLAWMAGGSLRDLLARESLSPARAAEIAGAVLSALGEAHRLGVLHRDIKPSNLLFDDGGAAKLADFGAAHLSESEATVTVGEIGTVAYMAPEQQLGHAATVQSDIYSVGVLLHEMLTKALPPLGSTSVSVQAAHPDLMPVHDELLQRFLARAPEARFATALQARASIDGVAWPTRIVAKESSSAQPIAKPIAESTSERWSRASSCASFAHIGQLRHDNWLGRDVLILPLEESTLSYASALARADHPALPLVLRADAETAELWVAAPRGSSLGEQKPWPSLTPKERARLRHALRALHRCGGVHGHVDLHHVYRHAGTVWLAFAAGPVDATKKADMAGLEALAR